MGIEWTGFDWKIGQTLSQAEQYARDIVKEEVTPSASAAAAQAAATAAKQEVQKQAEALAPDVKDAASAAAKEETVKFWAVAASIALGVGVLYLLWRTRK
jgi:uncharacterized membrane protein